MADVVDRSTRSRMMASIKGKNTAPEMFVQEELEKRHIANERFSRARQSANQNQFGHKNLLSSTLATPGPNEARLPFDRQGAVRF